MKRIPYILTALSIGFGFVLLFGSMMTLSSAQAAAPQATAHQNAILMDTSATMGQKISRFAAAHNNLTRPLTETITTHMLQFRDEVQYHGSTQDHLLASAWLSDLTAAGGGDCPDAGLKALRTLAQNAPSDSANPLNALLVSDAAPSGNRKHLIDLAHGLIKRDISVNVLQSGWCNDAQLSAEELEMLTILTGGAWMETDASNYYTDTLIALNIINRNVLLTSFSLELEPDEIFEHTLNIDPEVEEPETEERPHSWCCLTSTLRTAPSALPNITAVGPIDNFKVEIIAPNGQVIDSDIAGYRQLKSDFRRIQQGFGGCLTCTLRVGATANQTWTLRVSGEGPVLVNVRGISDVDVDYVGPRAVPVNRPIPFKANLGLTRPLTETFHLLSMDGMTKQPIELFDDGTHDDGLANDGLYGGTITSGQVGKWRLAVRGNLPTGEAFQRIDPMPIIFRSYNAPSPTDQLAMAGNQKTMTFVVSQDTTLGNRQRATTFDVGVFSEQGWVVTSTVPTSISLAAGETTTIAVPVTIPANATAGMVEQIRLVLAPTNDFGLSSVVEGEIEVVDSFKVMLPVLTR